MSRRLLPIEIGTMVKTGDFPHLPPDVSQELVNVYHRPGPRIEKRGGWKSDASGGGGANPGAGYMHWRDRTNNVDRLAYDNGSQNIYVKHATTEVWANITASAGNGGLGDWANYKGALYWMSNAGVSAQAYDGTVFDLDPFRERLTSLSMVAWKDRVWLFNVFQTVLNRMGTTNAYAAGFAADLHNVTEKIVTANGQTTTTWIPTSTTDAYVVQIAFLLAASAEEQFITFRSDILGVAPLYRVPMSLQLVVVGAGDVALRSTAYLVGSIRAPLTPNGFRYRATVAGTTGVGQPAWDVGIGTDTVDGTVTWHNDGTDAFASHEFEVDNATDNEGRHQTEGVVARIPPIPDILEVMVRWKFGNTARPTWELQPIVIGLKDGKADGHPQKKNFGQQSTYGQFPYEFFNQESSQTAVIRFRNRIICSEAGLVREWRGDVFWEMVDGSGDGVVLRPLQDTLCAFKRDAISVYQIVEGTAAAASPVRYVATFQGVGCIHVRAIDTLDGILYFIAEQGIYSFDAQGPPVDFTDDLMREAIFDRAAAWVENASLAPILKADAKNKELRIYTQTGKLWIYSLKTKKWTSQTITKDADNGASTIIDLAYFRDKFYAIATTNGLVREETATVQDEAAAGGPFDVTSDIYLHPYEAIPMTDALIESIELHGKITGNQTGSTLEVGISHDRGASFSEQHTITIPLSSDMEPILVPIWRSGANLTVRLRHVGKAGATYFNLFWAGMWMQTLGEEINDVTPLTVSATV